MIRLNRDKTEAPDWVEKRGTYPTTAQKNPFYRYLWHSVREDDQNEVIIVFGRPGSCKSGFGLKLMHDMDLTWVPEKNKYCSRAKFSNIIFSVQELVKLSTSYMPAGTTLMYDEAGVESDNTSYHETRAQVLRYVLQTWRYKNAILVITLPSLRSLTVGIRRLATVYVEAYGRRARDKTHAWARITFVQHRGKGDKEQEYQKYLRFQDENDGVVVTKRLKWYKFAVPNKVMEWKYKKMKMAQTAEWYSGFGGKKLTEDMNFMASLLGNKGGKKKSAIAEEAEEIYQKYRKDLDKFTTIGDNCKYKLVRGLFEKKIRDDGVSVSESGMRKAFAWMRGDFETVNLLKGKVGEKARDNS